MSVEYDTEGDKTQPSEDIISVLRMLEQHKQLQQPQSHSNSPPAPGSAPVSPVKTEQKSPPIPTAPPAPPAPVSEWDQLRSRLEENPFEPNDWNRLIYLAEESAQEPKIKEAYEGLLKAYPNSSAAQIAFLNYYLNLNDFQKAEALFSTWIKPSPSVDLWKFYLVYVRRVNSGSAPATREIVKQAYEFALGRVGQDKDSAEIWADYIQFIKSGETTSQWEEQQKMDLLRKIYHRAVQIPLENVESIWRELDAFENNLNKITAKKFLTDLSPSYMTAKSTLRELRGHMNSISAPSSSASHQNQGPPFQLPRPPRFDQNDRTTVGAWKQYLKWEESNPLMVEEKEKPALIQRVQLMYRKAVVRMRFFPEIWYMAYVWTAGVGKQEEALGLLRSGIEANPASFVLNFALAEALEQKPDLSAVHVAYNSLLDVIRKDIEAMNKANPPPPPAANNASAILDGVTQELTNAEQNQNTATNGTTHDGTAATNGGGTEPNSKNSSFATQSSEGGQTDRMLADRKSEFGLVWIMYMRFARRAEGLKSSRAVFKRAMRDPWAPWEVYEASALMEYHLKDVGVATRIFQKGLERFKAEVEFVLRYLGFLISVNDEANARSVFNGSIEAFSKEDARPLWERWARYVYQYGDLTEALALEKRLAEAYPLDPPIKRFAQRHTYLNRDAIAARDLGFAYRNLTSAPSASASVSTALNALGRTDTLTSLMRQSDLTIPSSASSSMAISGSASASASASAPSAKRDRSPDGRKRREDESPSYKRQRGASPPPRERDRWLERERERERDSLRRKGGSPGPGWLAPRGPEPPHPHPRDVEPPITFRRADHPPPPPPSRAPPPPERDMMVDREREEEKAVVLPHIVKVFIEQLPPATSFDGPVFRTDDLLQLFRNAVIPSSTGPARVRSPPPPPPPPSRAPVRPPPDYGPYQGPGGGQRAPPPPPPIRRY